MLVRAMEMGVSKVPRAVATPVTKICRKDKTVVLATGQTIRLVSLFDHRGRPTLNVNAAKRAVGHHDGVWYEVSFLDMEARITDEPPELPAVHPIVPKTQH